MTVCAVLHEVAKVSLVFTGLFVVYYCLFTGALYLWQQLWRRGLISRRPDVLGGEPVFPGTRLSLYHVGKMYDQGVAVEDIIADYPYLDKADIELAWFYYKGQPE